MRVKVGNQWFEAKPDQPIAVELTDQDKANIAGMLSHCTRYGIFHDDDLLSMSTPDMCAWMAA